MIFFFPIVNFTEIVSIVKYCKTQIITLVQRGGRIWTCRMETGGLEINVHSLIILSTSQPVFDLLVYLTSRNSNVSVVPHTTTIVLILFMFILTVNCLFERFFTRFPPIIIMGVGLFCNSIILANLIMDMLMHNWINVSNQCMWNYLLVLDLFTIIRLLVFMIVPILQLIVSVIYQPLTIHTTYKS